MLTNKRIIAAVMGMIGIIINEIIFATAQDSTNQSHRGSSKSEKQTLVVTWLETNNTKTGSAPVNSVSSEDFWKIFEPLLKLKDGTAKKEKFQCY
jgi:hypothetical protein